MKFFSVIVLATFICYACSSAVPRKEKQPVDYSQSKRITGSGGRALTSLGVMDGKEYYINPDLEPISFGEALDYCHGFDMSMGSIYTLNQEDWVWYHVPTGYSMWLAGTDLFQEGTWVWMKSQLQFVFIRWALGQPYISNVYNCLYLNESSNDWWSTECGQGRFQVLCEVDVEDAIQKH